MKDLLPAYAAGTLTGTDRDAVRAHLADCPACRADLAAWRAIARAAPPPGPAPDPERLVRAVLSRSAAEPDGTARPGGRRPVRRLAALLAAEARLIRPAVPIASALVMALGVVVVLLPATAGGDLVLALVAPIVAAAGVAGTFRSGHDPAAEVLAATPTSGRLLLLVRLVLVFGLDLALALAASAVLAATGAAGTASMTVLVAAWLGPMVLLCALSLLAAVRWGPDAALGVAVTLWAIRVLAGGVLARGHWPARLIVDAWATTAPVLTAGAAAAVAAFVLAGREPRDGRRATHLM